MTDTGTAGERRGGRPCSICTHRSRRVIDERLLMGVPCAQVARDFGLGVDAVERHRRNHLVEQMRAAQEAGASGPRLAVIEGEVLLGQAGAIYERALSLLDSLDHDETDARARVYALREVRAALETLAKLNAQLETRSAGTVRRTEAATIDAAIVRALEERGQEVGAPPPQAHWTRAADGSPLALPPGS